MKLLREEIIDQRSMGVLAEGSNQDGDPGGGHIPIPPVPQVALLGEGIIGQENVVAQIEGSKELEEGMLPVGTCHQHRCALSYFWPDYAVTHVGLKLNICH